MNRNISKLIVGGIGIVLIAAGLLLKVPGTELTTYSIFEGESGYSVIDEYVGGDAYNYIIGASLVGGEIAGMLAMKGIFIAVGVLILCLVMLSCGKEAIKATKDDIERIDGQQTDEVPIQNAAEIIVVDSETYSSVE